MVLSGEQEKEYYLCEDEMMQISDPRDGFFYPTLTLMIDTYILFPGY